MSNPFKLRSIRVIRSRSFFPKILILLLLFTGVLYSGNAQTSQKTISGKVVDKDGTPLIGATVMIINTTIGVVADMDGNFTINVPENAILRVSYLGFATQELPVGDKTFFNIIMLEDSNVLAEVVKVAYGTQKKVSVVGSVAAVGREDIIKSSAPNLTAALAGRLPGLTTLQTSGQPGRDDVLMYVRGVSTFGGGTSPLILIDGVPRSNISSLDPSEIENITILKDASATAVFGVRGANGVILITTRRGKVGSMNIDILYKQSFQSPLYHRDDVDSWEFAHLRNEALRNDGKLPEFSDSEIMKFKEGDDPFYPNRDIQAEIFKNYSPQTQINVNMSGGTDAVQYFVSGGYLNQGSIFKQEGGKGKVGYDPSFSMDRFNLRLNVDYLLTKGMKVNLDLGGDIRESTAPLAGGLGGQSFESIAGRVLDIFRKTRPVDPGPLTVAGYKNNLGEDVEAGIPVYTVGGFNIWELINVAGYTQSTRSNFNSSIGLDWELDYITKGLSTKALIAFDVQGNSNLIGMSALSHRYIVNNPEDHLYTWAEPVDNGSNYADIVRLSRGYLSEYRINMQYQLNYNRTFAEKHNVTGMFLAQRDNWIYQTSNEQALPFNMLGIAGRLTYSYDDRYLAEVNLGYNGSEQFTKKKRFGFFPAVSVGWVISNEEFMKNIKGINILKLRGSYGKVGNDKFGNNPRYDARFLYLDNIIMTGGGVFGALGYGQGVGFNLIGNPSLTWETEDKKNLGLDLELASGIFLNFDYYKNFRSGILATRSDIPSFQGITQLPLLNIGEMKNWGGEIVLGYRKIFNKDLSVNVSSNFAFNDNEIVFISEQSRGEAYVYPYRSEGHRYGQHWGYKIDYSNGNGYINTVEELEKYKPMYENGTVGSPTLGDFAYIDQNGDGKISDEDMVPIGYGALPRINYSAILGTQYKGFDFSVQFQGIGQASRNFNYFIPEAPDGFAGYYNGVHRQSWTEERYLNGEPIEHPALHTSSSNSSYMGNDYYIQDRSFLRLKMVELGYSIPESLTQKLNLFKSARFSVSGQNLITWDRLITTDIDPEQESTYSYPLSRIVTFNVTLNF